MNARPLPAAGSPPASGGSELARAKRNEVLAVDTPTGNLTLYMPAPQVLLGIARGHLSEGMADRWIAEMTPRVQGDAVLVGFHDWQLLTGYDSRARYALTRFVVSTGPRQRGHLLVSSRMVAMGVSAASLTAALAGVKLESYASRARFENVLNAALHA